MSCRSKTCYRSRLLRLALAAGLILAFGQQEVRAQFTTIINVPPNIGNDQSIGSNTQLNVTSGGSVGHNFDAGNSNGTSSNVEVNVSLGAIGDFFDAYSGSTINILNGSLGSYFYARPGSTVNFHNGSISGSLRGDGSVINIHGGTIGPQFTIGDATTVNITNGFIGTAFWSLTNGTINISGGSIGGGFLASSGTKVSISGGFMAPNPTFQSGSIVEMLGNEFRLDGELIAGLDSIGNTVDVNVPAGSVISGVYADGTPFAFRKVTNNLAAPITLKAAALPAIGPPSIVVSSEENLQSVRSGQTITIVDGGSLFALHAGRDSTVNLTGGRVGNFFRAIGADVNITSGEVSSFFEAYDGSHVSLSADGQLYGGIGIYTGSVATISGGYVASEIRVGPNSELNISGGRFESSTINADVSGQSGSTINITGGVFGDPNPFYELETFGELNFTNASVTRITAQSGGHVMISGGTIQQVQAASGGTVAISGGKQIQSVTMPAGSELRFVGGEFRINNIPVEGLDAIDNQVAVAVPAGAVISGTYADGLPFAFASTDGDSFASSTIMLQSAALPPVGPATISLPADPVPAGIRGGQQLVINDQGNVPDDFNVGAGSSITVAGGTIGANFEIVGSTFTMHSGAVGMHFDAYSGAVVQVFGGSVGGGFTAHKGSRVYGDGGTFAGPIGVIGEFNLSAGSIGNSSIITGGTLNISGGTVGTTLKATAGGKVNITGGSIGSSFRIEVGSFANIFGGTIGNGPVSSASIVNVFGGTIGTDFQIQGTSVVNFTGGTTGRSVEVTNTSEVNMSGGTVGIDFDANSGTKINLFGTQFTLAGSDITSSLSAYVPLTITNRNVTLSGTLLDGSAFEFILNSSNQANIDFFHTGATVTVTLVTDIFGDFNEDGTVNAADYTVWRNALGTSVAVRGKSGDGNFDGKVTEADYSVWKAHFGESDGQAPSVPEPASVVLVLLAAAVVCGFRLRRQK